ncbi:MAG: hypothetical protein WKH64_18715 [Chloroflexia bacterium]
MTFLAGTGIPLPDAVQRPRSRAHPPAGRSRTWARDHRDPQATARDDAQARELDLGAFTVPLRPGGFFLANVPEDRWKHLANTAGEGRIVDASGAAIRTGCVNWGPSPTDPAA